MEYVICSENVILSIDTSYNGELKIEQNCEDIVITEINADACNNGKITLLDLSETSITTIGNAAFCYCYDLCQVIFPNTIVSLGINSFALCNLSSLYIPASLIDFNGWAFNQLHSLINVTVDEDNNYFTSIDNYILSKDLTTIVLAPPNYFPSDLDSFINITKIGPVAFAGHSIPKFCGSNKVELLDSYSFTKCNKLQFVDLSETKLTYISAGCFAECWNIKMIYLPKMLTTMYDNSFSFTNIQYISLPQTLTSIYDKAFLSCPKIKRVIYYGSVDFSSTNLFTHSTPRIHVTTDYPSEYFSNIQVIRNAYDYWLKNEMKPTCNNNHIQLNLIKHLIFIIIFIYPKE